MKFALAALLSFGALVGQANAEIIHYELTGMYQDGQTLGGGFDLDTTKPVSSNISGSSISLSRFGTYRYVLSGSKVQVDSRSVGYSFTVDEQISRDGILNFYFTGNYDAVSQTVPGLDTGPIPFSSLYGLGHPYGTRTCVDRCDMILVSGMISTVPEPLSVAVLGTAVLGAVGFRRSSLKYARDGRVFIPTVL